MLAIGFAGAQTRKSDFLIFFFLPSPQMHIFVRKLFSFLYLTAGNSIAKSETTVFPEGNSPKIQSGSLVSDNYMKYGGHYYRKAYSKLQIASSKRHQLLQNSKQLLQLTRIRFRNTRIVRFQQSTPNSVPYELIKYFDCQFAVENGHAFYYSVIMFPVRNISSGQYGPNVPDSTDRTFRTERNKCSGQC